MATAAVTRYGTRLTRTLLRCGAVAGPLFIGTFLIEGATRDDYDPLRHPVSSLALGPHGWVQTTNFAVTGGLYLGYCLGLWRTPGDAEGERVGTVLIGAAAVGLLGAAAFITDAVSGYPLGTPDAAGSYTTAGALHDLFSVPTFPGLPAATLAFSRSFARRGDTAGRPTPPVPGWQCSPPSA